jgi:hypothetical protein
MARKSTKPSKEEQEQANGMELENRMASVNANLAEVPDVADIVASGYNEYRNTGGIIYLRDMTRIMPNETFICRAEDLGSKRIRDSVVLLERNIEVEEMDVE